jgi:hypothetical protein
MKKDGSVVLVKNKGINKVPRPTRGCNRLGQGSKRERLNAIVEFLLEW